MSNDQSGFRPGDSTINQLLFLVNEIHEAFLIINNNKEFIFGQYRAIATQLIKIDNQISNLLIIYETINI